jgi:hypothetical protein
MTQIIILEIFKIFCKVEKTEIDAVISKMYTTVPPQDKLQ